MEWTSASPKAPKIAPSSPKSPTEDPSPALTSAEDEQGWSGRGSSPVISLSSLIRGKYSQLKSSEDLIDDYTCKPLPHTYQIINCKT